ncbi:YdcF family protein [Deinococcus fonticola]|uniref:YdcF family protein n=1 Tax=Deinococcus fonticola TaxID=2528713 RepID=UPI001F10B6EA|nr:YdcF family protein [Deinococcus fonticola]
MPESLAPRNHPWRGLWTGLVLGGALSVLAAFVGGVRATTGLLLLLTAVCGLLGLYRPARRLLQVGGSVLVALLFLCLMTPILRSPLAALTLKETPVPADAVVVLGGGVQCGTRALASSSFTRLIMGLQLWREGYAPMVTVSEQSGLIGAANCPKMSVLEREYIRRLYPTGGPQVLTLRNVTTTRDEASRVGEYARIRGWNRVLLVTSPSHSRRAAGIFRAYGVQVVSVPAPEILFDETLPTPEDRLYALKTLLYEGLSRVKFSLGGTPER